MEDIINATLAGGVAIGASSGVVVNMGVSLTIGIIAGFVSNIAYAKLMHKLEHGFLGIHDTCGVHNLHGIRDSWVGSSVPWSLLPIKPGLA
jgi:ammonium transporter Rh